MLNVHDRSDPQAILCTDGESPGESTRSGAFYLPQGSEENIFLAAHEAMLPLMLKGPTGCGKTRFVEAMAERLGLELVTVACNEDTSAADLVGRYLIEGMETIWRDGPVARAVRAGCLLYLDEIAEARSDVITVLHSLADHRRQLFIDRTNECVVAPRRFMLIASYNPGYQQGIKELKPSLRQRFVSLDFTFSEPEDEATIIVRETGMDAATAKKLVKVANKVRRLGEAGMSAPVSTRLLVNAGKLIVHGVPLRTACESAILTPLDDDPETLKGLREIVNLIL